ncbi:hypothetical protein GGI00_002353, partial [Coemansia sp. RSA 2681]
LKVLDLQFLRRSSSSDSSDALSRQRQPAFAVLYEDANMARLVRAYSLDSAAAPQQQQGSLLQPQTLWTSEHVEATASMLVPLARGAVLVVGDSALTVVAGSRAAVILSKRAARPTAFEWVDAQACERLLLADDSGTLSLVVLQYDASGHVRALFTERLGGISAASSLSYLADGCVYVGSQCGDHAVVRLHAEPLGSEPYDYDRADDVLAHPLGTGTSAGEARPITFVEVLESFACLAPVVDLCVVGMGGGGGSVVTCSGLRSTPGLRVVRNGVGVETVAEVAGIGGVVSAWSLTAEISGSESHSGPLQQQVVLVLSLVDRTRVLGWTEADGDSALELAELSEEEEEERSGWRLDAVTLAAGLAGDGRHAVQVTPRAVLLLQIVEGGAWRQCAAWQAPAPAVISAASAVGDQIAVAVDGSLVVYIEVRGSALACVAQQRLAHAVACVDVHSWAPPGQPSAFVAVGLWAEADSDSNPEAGAGSVRLLALPGLQQTAGVSLRADAESAVPRSLLMCVLGGSAHLAVGGGDGRLHTFGVSHGGRPTSGGGSCVRLGARPLALAAVRSGGVASVFAAGDHAAMLYAANGNAAAARLLCAPVDAQDVRCVARVQSRALPDALLLVTAAGAALRVATADAAQRLHVRARALPAFAAPHRVAFSAALAVYGVATIHAVGGSAADQTADLMADLTISDQAPSEVARFSVLGGAGGGAWPARVLGSLLLRAFEMPESLCVAALGGGREFFVLGTSTALPGEDDARRGRVLALAWDARAQRIVEAGAFAALGAVYAVAPFRGMLLAAAGSRLLLLGWQEEESGGGGELAALCSQQTQIAALSLAVSGDYVIVGDVMASAAVFRYEADSSVTAQQQQPRLRHRLVPVARDYAGVWTTCVAAVPPNPSNPSAIAEQQRAITTDESQLAPALLRDPTSERFVVADAYNNIFRAALVDQQQQRLLVEARWHVADQINVIRGGSLVMDVPDPDFPGVFRATHVFGTVQGAIGVIASVDDGRVGRILDRLQVNLAHLLPTPGLWDYDEWRSYASDQRMSRAFGFLDGDLIERFLDLAPELQRLVFEGGGGNGGGGGGEAKEAAERRRKAEYWADHARVEAEGEIAVLAQMSVSDIGEREPGVTLDYVVRLVECLTRLH